METSPSYHINVTSPNNTCYTQWDPYFLTSHHTVIIIITTLLSVISTFTVLANCVIITAISRAYFCGISSPVSSKSPRLSATNLIKRCQSHFTKCEDRTGEDHQPVEPVIPSVSHSISAGVSSDSEFHLSPDCACQEMDLVKGEEKRPNAGSDILLTAVEIEPERNGAQESGSKTSSLGPADICSDPLSSTTAAIGILTLCEIENTARPKTNTCTTPTEIGMASADDKPSFSVARTFSHTDISIKTSRTAVQARARTVPTLQAQSTYNETVTRPCRRIRLTNRSSNIPIVLMFSMALSDFMLAAVIMPLSTIELYHNGNWRFGLLSCEIRMTLDIVLSTTSIYHVTCMAADRYLAICRPFFHRKLSVRAGFVAVAVCWALPVAMISFFHIPQAAPITITNAFPPNCSGIDLMNFTDQSTVSTPYTDTNREAYSHKKLEICEQRLTVVLQSVSVTLSFYIPFISIVVLYALVLVEVRKSLKRRTGLQSGIKSKGTVRASFQGVVNIAFTDLSDTGVYRSINKEATDMLTTYTRENQSTKISCDTKLSSSFRRKDLTESKGIHNTYMQRGIVHVQRDSAVPLNDAQSGGNFRGLPTISFNGNKLNNSGIVGKARTIDERNTKGSKNNFRAMKTVGLVIVCFTICWLPFSIFVLFWTVTDEDVSYWTVVLITWFGYVNSSLNPVLYCGHWMVRAALRDLFCRETRREK